jgi:acyl carrier protein
VDQTVWPPEFEQVVSARLTSPPPPGDLKPDLDLTKAGIDSLETIGLMVDLEDTFNVTIPDDLLTVDTFATPGALWQALRQCLRPSDA